MFKLWAVTKRIKITWLTHFPEEERIGTKESLSIQWKVGREKKRSIKEEEGKEKLQNSWQKNNNTLVITTNIKTTN